MKLFQVVSLSILFVSLLACEDDTSSSYPNPNDPSGQNGGGDNNNDDDDNDNSSGDDNDNDNDNDGGGSSGGYYTSGNKIMTPSGKVAKFNGMNWYGFEDDEMVVHGLGRRDFDEYVDQLVDLGYNLIRLPWSNEMIRADEAVNDAISYDKNPEFEGKTPLEWFDMVIERLTDEGIKILLDRHRIRHDEQSPLWYDGGYTEEVWIDDWKLLAKRYKSNENVIGADLHNEPHGVAGWGLEDESRDWRSAAIKCGNAIHEVNSNWLIIVEGTEKNVVANPSGWSWWGSNLSGVKEHPIELKVKNKLVYSIHEYGPEMGSDSMVWLEDLPNRLEERWDEYFGYIHKEEIAPILVGEFGARDVSADTDSGIWFRALIDYIGENEMYWTFWTWTPDSSDTYGLLKADWETLQDEKQSLLEKLY